MKIRVLVADDHAVMREGLAALLGAAGIEVVATARDGREAVQAASRSAPDVALLDLSRPLLNGIDAIREIRARLPEVRIVVLSMHSDRYVLKGAAAADVVAAVRSARLGRPSSALGSPTREKRAKPARSPACPRAKGRCCSSWRRESPAPRSPG